MAAVAPAVMAPGHIDVDLELNRGELEQLVQRLKAAVEATRPPASAPQPPQNKPAPQQQQQQQRQRQQQQPPPVAAPPSPSAAQPRTPPPPAQQSAPPPPPPLRQVSPGKGEWQATWTTDALDHDGMPISDMAFAAAIKGLPGGDGHGGWLISASDRMLNLWELSGARRASGDPGLMLMHSQMKEAAPAECLDVEPSMLRLLVATRSSSFAETPYITSHWLSDEASFLGEQSAYLLQPLRPAGAPAFHRASQVVSLHSWGGPLTGTCAAAFDGSILVFPMTRTGARAVVPKAEWRAHAGGITALHRSSFGIRLFSGSVDGKAHMWDMTGKPTAPMQTFAHGAAVTKVLHVRENVLALAGADGNITLWDPRSTAHPVRTISLGSGRITAMAASAPGDSLLAGTADGIFHVDPSEPSGAVQQLPTPAGWVTTSLKYNTRTGSFYASSAAGTITCFARLLW